MAVEKTASFQELEFKATIKQIWSLQTTKAETGAPSWSGELEREREIKHTEVSPFWFRESEEAHDGVSHRNTTEAQRLRVREKSGELEIFIYS